MTPWLLLAAALASIPQLAFAGTATISGTVFGDGPGPLPGVVVSAWPRGGGDAILAVTGPTGGFLLHVPAPEGYLLTAQPGGPWVDVYYPGTVSLARAALVAVLPGDARTGVDFHLPIGHVVSGTASVESGVLPSYSVTLFDAAGWTTSIYGGFSSASWQLPRVPPGAYVVAATPAGGTFAPTYYGGSSLFSEATPVTVSDSPVTGLGLTFPARPLVTGTVTLPGGAALANASVQAWSLEWGFPRSVSTTADASGHFVLSGLAPGLAVTLGTSGSAARREFGFEGGTVHGYSATSFTVAPGPNPGHDFSPAANGPVTGVVTETGGAGPVENGSVGLANVVTVYAPLGWNGGVLTNAEGAFRFGSVKPGRYFPSVVFSDYHVGETAPSFIDVGTGPVAGVDLQVILGGKASVTVTKEGDPSAGIEHALVELYDAACRRVESGHTDSNGVHEFSAVAPGSYRLLGLGGSAYSAGIGDAWYGGGASCAASGTLSVGAGATTTVGLALPAVGEASGAVVSGVVTDAATGGAVADAYLLFRRTAGGWNILAFPDDCGMFASIPLPDGTYDVSIFLGNESFEFPSSFTAAGAPIRRDYTVTVHTGELSGTVWKDGAPLRGTAALLYSGSSLVDTTATSGGRYLFTGLTPGAYKVAAVSFSGLRHRFFGGTTSIEMATPVAVSDGACTSNVDITLDVPVAADPFEPDETGTPMLLTTGPPTPRAFGTGDDVDWLRFQATKGCTYKLTIVTQLAEDDVSKGFFDSATRAVESGLSDLTGKGWVAPSTGERWVALSSRFPTAYALLFESTCHDNGDADGDGDRDVGDVFYLINYLFAGGPNPLGPVDANGDGQVNVTDVFYLINYLFAGGPAPL